MSGQRTNPCASAVHIFTPEYPSSNPRPCQNCHTRAFCSETKVFTIYDGGQLNFSHRVHSYLGVLSQIKVKWMRLDAHSP
jgi:hypothetical protein